MTLGTYKTREELTNLFEEKRLLNRGVELGSYEGFFAKSILDTWKGNLYLIDVWRELNNQEYQDVSNQTNYENIVKKCFDNLKDYEDRAFMIRAKGEDVVDLFNNESLDFVYIDANHKYDFVKKDIRSWYPKVRKGGVIAGHDYLKINWYADPSFHENKKDKHIWSSTTENPDKYTIYNGLFGVNPAVDEFCEQLNIKFYTTEEWFGSWYFIK